MNGIVARVRENFDAECRSTICKKGICSLKLDDLPQNRVLLDLDCDRLPGVGDHTRCDYLLVAESELARIVPIELKGGKFDCAHAVKQLQGGVDALGLGRWLFNSMDWELVPLIAHKKGVHREELKRLRARKIKLGGRSARPELIRCGRSLGEKLGPG